tara:strand:- start:681 stop:1088 length:408 start_codon:yes stop_codon:yes gene_type:complete
MSTRNNPDTSHKANKLMTDELKNKDYKKILEAFDSLGSTTYDKLADWCFFADSSRVSKRLKEMEGLSLICKTGEKRLTKSGRNANMYRRLVEGEVAPTIEKEHYMEGQTTAADYASKLLAATKEGKLKQSSIFGD